VAQIEQCYTWLRAKLETALSDSRKPSGMQGASAYKVASFLWDAVS
jgi:hypothetical protein